VSVTSQYALIKNRNGARLLRITDDGFRDHAPAKDRTTIALQTEANGLSRVLLSDADGSHLFMSNLDGDSVGPGRLMASGAAGEFSASDEYIHAPSANRLFVFRKVRLQIIGAEGTMSTVPLTAREYTKFDVSDDGRFVAIATSPTNMIPEPLGPDAVEIIDVAAGRGAARIELPTHVAVMRFGHAGNLAIAANAVTQGEAGFRLKVFEPRQWTPIADVQMPSRSESLAFSPDDALIAVGQRDSTTAVVNRNGTRVLNAPQRGRVVFCEFFDNGAKLATISSRTDLTTMQLMPASRAALAERLLQVAPFVP
jgi:hypothetical protein